MLFRNWIEVGVFILINVIGVIIKIITLKKRKKADGLIGVNNQTPGKSYILK